MEDKIDELIEQSMQREVLYPQGCDGRSQTSVYFDKRKFAELIINECVELLNQQEKDYKSPASYESTEYYIRCAAKADAFADAVRIIEHHFKS